MLENLKVEKITGIEFASQNGLVIWREVCEIGPVGNWQKTDFKDGDAARLKLLRKELQEKYGEEVKI